MAMRHVVLIVLSFSVFRHSVSAAGGSIAGRVTAAVDGGSLSGVNVRLQGTVRGTTTNARGEYRVPDIPAGKRSLVFSIVGYLRENRPDVTVEEGKETVVDVVMTQSAIQSEQVVVTASKREQSLQDVPVSVSVLDAAEISQRNSTSLEDALRYIPGVNMTGTQVNIRGSSGYSLGAGSRVLMLLDGIPFLAGDTGELNFESIPMGQVDRIEVVKGASSALYGSNALGGVVNIITKPIPETPETTVRTYGGLYNKPAYGQWDWSDRSRFFNGQSFSHMRRVGDLGVSLFFSRQFDDGYRQNDYRRRYNFLMKTREELSSSGSVTLTFGLAYQYMGQFLYWRNVDSALITPLRHQSDNIKSTRYFLSGLYNTAFTDNFLFTIKAMWYHNDWGFQQSGDPERTESISDGVRVEALATLLPGESHTLTCGVDGNIDLIGGDMFGDRQIGGLALFAQDEAKVLKDLTLTLGARFDFQSVGLTGEGGQLNPKIALLYRPAAGTTLRASYGEGFRVPSLPEAFVEAGSTGLLAVPNKDLKPERSKSYEAGVSQSLGDNGSIDIAAFRSDIDNLIEPGLFAVGADLEIQWRNVTRARVQGVETSCQARFFSGDVVCNLGYTYLYPEDLTLNDILKYRPRHVLHGDVRGRFGWLSASADFRYVSRIERIDDELVDAGVIPDGDQRVPIYVTDIRVGADLSFTGIPLSLSLNVNNIFQHNYVELIGNVMPPRTYVLVLESRL
jgi:outer membrane receptor for ferrienterochelin and colicins